MNSRERLRRLLTLANTINWPTLLAGVVLGMIGLHLLAGRPLNDRLDRIQVELDLVRSGLHDVAGSRTDVVQTNDLLAALTEQRSRIDSASDALEVIDGLTTDVVRSSTKAGQAETALDQIVDLNKKLISTAEQRAEVAAAVDNVRELQIRVAGIGADSQQALKLVGDAELALADLDQLKMRIIESAGELKLAREAVDAVIALQRDLAAADDSTDQARAAADRLIALKDGFNGNVSQIGTAEQNLERLIALQDRLATDEQLQFYEAASNVERLINIQAEIAAQTDSLVDSITALELLSDFQDEFNGQATGIEEMRRQLTELILLQTTVDQAVQIIEPISELGNLRRLDSQELREAARIILDQRRARLDRRDQVANVASADAADADSPQPPQEDVESPAPEIHPPEIHRPVPVPPEEL